MSRAFASDETEKAFRQYGRAIENFCRVSLGEARDSAADCVQETFYVYHKRLLAGESFGNPRAFLYKTANIMVLKAKEKYFKEARRTKPLDDAEALTVTMDSLISDETDYDKLKDILISKLNPKEQALYEMKYAEQLSLKEIGEKLGIAPAAAANRLMRLRTKVKGLIEPTLKDYGKGEMN